MKRVLAFVLLAWSFSSAAITNYYHVKTDGTGSIADSADTWADAWNEDTLKKYLEASVAAGSVFYVLQGSYVLPATIDFSLLDGTAVSPITFIGVKTGTTDTASAIDTSDWSRVKWQTWDTASAPSINCGDYQFKTGDYTVVKNLKFYGASPGTGSYVFYNGIGNTQENCVFNCNYGSSASRYALYAGAYSVTENCVLLSANCKGMSAASSSCRIIGNVFSGFADATNGIAIAVNGHGGIIANNMFASNMTSVLLVSFDYTTVLNNTFWRCGINVSATDAFGFVGINNLSDSTKVGAYKWTTQTDGNFFWGNHGSDARCTDMWDGVAESGPFADYSVTTGDPLFVNPAADSLQLQHLSPARNTGTGLK
jgi:hypothetical protein